MEKIGVFYATTGGKTAAIADEIDFNLRKDEYDIINVGEEGINRMADYKNLILITPTYGVGEVQEDWGRVLPEMEKMNLAGKRIAVAGLGNQFAFGESFVGGMRGLYDAAVKAGAEVIGFTSTEGYKYEESEAVIDNHFVGLALDENNQDDETPERVMEWVAELKKEFY